jgi:biotin carboxyl carrier protein
MIYYTESTNENLRLEIKETHEGHTVVCLPDGRETIADLTPILGGDFYSLLLDNHSYEVHVEPSESGYAVSLNGAVYQIKVQTEREHRLAALTQHSNVHSGEAVVKAPMPGLVSQVAVEVGQSVTQGQRLLILEAMKMENELRAPRAGVIKAVHIQNGQTVEQNRPLIVLE